MWFRNLTLYMIPGFPLSADDLAAALSHTPFEPCQSYSDKSSGWTPARNDAYVYSVDGEHMITLRTSRKLLPGSVLKQAIAASTAAFVKERGHKPGKVMRRELKEQAYDELLPKAFEVERDIRAWISPKRGILAIDTASQSAADKFIASFIRAAETPFTIYPARFVNSPVGAMTQWVADESPLGFVIDSDSTTFSSQGSSANIKYSGVTLEAADARRQIDGGRVVTTLALSWDDKASFILKGGGKVQHIAPIGVMKTSKKDAQDDDIFASDFLLMTASLGDMLADLSESLGGFKAVEDLFAEPQDDESDADEGEAHAAPADPYAEFDNGDEDPLVQQANDIVIAQGRASISLVQRHLRIGYNRAARLLETLETRGVVSPMNSNGNRTITGATK